jgi:DNA-binding NtrC family response regulator
VGEILLIAEDWQLRALVRAQLLEEGYQVRALPSLDVALAFLLRGAEPPCLILVDMEGCRIEPCALTELWQLTGQAPLIVCGGAVSQATLAQKDLPPAQVLLRPFRVGDLVGQVRRALAWPDGLNTEQ